MVFMRKHYSFAEQLETLAEEDANKRRAQTIINTRGEKCDAIDYSPGEKEKSKVKIKGKTYEITYEAVRFGDDNF